MPHLRRMSVDDCLGLLGCPRCEDAYHRVTGSDRSFGGYEQTVRHGTIC